MSDANVLNVHRCRRVRRCKQMIFTLLSAMSLVLLLVVHQAAGGDAEDDMIRFKVDSAHFHNGEIIEIESLLLTIRERLGEMGEATLLGNDGIQINFEKELTRAQLEALKWRFGALGSFQFSLLANTNHPEHRRAIQEAESLHHSEKLVSVRGEVVAEWVPIALLELGTINSSAFQPVDRETDRGTEVFIMLEGESLSGEYLASAKKGSRPCEETAYLLLLQSERR